MSKNKIIPQMFDVRPVDETGDLDWKKIQSIGANETEFCNENRNLDLQMESELGLEENDDGAGVKAYILGVPVESKIAPIFHDPNFRICDNLAFENKALPEKKEEQEKMAKRREIEEKRQQKILEEKRREEKRLQEIEQQNRIFQLQSEKRRIEQQKILAEQAGRERMLREQQVMQHEAQQERIRQEALKYQEEIRKNAELKRLEQEAKQSEMVAEKKRKEQERLLQLEIEKKQFELRQQILEEIQISNRQKEVAIAAEKMKLHQERQESIRREAAERQQQLRETIEYQRSQQMAYEETVRIEKEKRKLKYEKWLQEDRLKTVEAQKKKRKASSPWFSKLKKKKRMNYGNNSSQDVFSWKNILFPSQFSFQFDSRGSLAMFAALALTLSFGIGGISYASKGFGLKGRVLGVSQDGYTNLTSAMKDMADQNFEGSTRQFSEALANFSQASQDLDDMGGVLLDATRFVPFASKISSGRNAVEAGKHFSAAGQSLNEIVSIVAKLKNPIDGGQQNDVSLLDVLESAEKNITTVKNELDSAQKNIDQIAIDDLPEDKQAKFLLLKQKLPEIRSGLDLYQDNSHILVELLGGNGPRKYLFLFQNNTEMRATGGFIGSYGLLDIANGQVKKFFIDGIFNPDGQLKDKIVPPVPIQKISANWSMHDSNWFADFPLSAKKAINFYEKTGGPTADGVITLTPTVMQKLLEITGPIEMPEYDVTLSSENFIELTQYKVEVDYDKEENRPKKILSDLAPMVMDKLLRSKDLDSISKAAQALLAGLQEKHIILYSQNAYLQDMISKQGWSGEVLSASKDYVSVINSNINGYKTDAVVEENIAHKAEIQVDGSIVDTLTITRKHKGGSSKYEWLNKVNADYMRVYVPEGSKLLEVSGQTRETNTPPLDYDALGFKRDEDVQKEEQSIVIDPESGTRIYSESGKTVFANWTYVSPGETMTLTYKYALPFSLFHVSVGSGKQVDSYSLVAQKQSGSIGSSFNSTIAYPQEYDIKWNFPENAEKNASEIKSQQSLQTDRYLGVVFEKK